MPLARIVTACVTEAVPLARRLREQGYSVEIVSPGTLVATPADVEFTVERLAGAAALACAAEFSSAYDADVHVAPGTLAVERPLPKAPAAPAREVVSISRPFAGPSLSPPVPEAQGGEPLRSAQLPERSATQTEAHPFREVWQQTLKALRDAGKSAVAQLGAASRDVKQHAAGLERPLRGGAHRAVGTVAALRRKAALGFMGWARSAHLWEQRVYAQAKPHAVVLSARAKECVAATTRTELQRAGRIAAAFGQALRTLPVALGALTRRGLAAVPRHAPVGVSSARRREWNFALAGAAIASLVVTLGWAAYMNRRPAAELLPRAEVAPPAGKGATLAPSPAPLASPAISVPAPPTSAPRLRVQPVFARPERDEVAEDSVVYHRAPRSEAGVEETSDDEVTVRHYPRRTREQAATPTRSGVKKISDLD